MCGFKLDEVLVVSEPQYECAYYVCQYIEVKGQSII